MATVQNSMGGVGSPTPSIAEDYEYAKFSAVETFPPHSGTASGSRVRQIYDPWALRNTGLHKERGQFLHRSLEIANKSCCYSSPYVLYEQMIQFPQRVLTIQASAVRTLNTL